MQACAQRAIGEGWGNGKAIAILLARQGAGVFGCDLDLAAGQATRELIQDEGGVAEVQVCDVTKAADVKALVDACLAKFGRIVPQPVTSAESIAQ